jgi:hypothetical protein
MARNSSIRQRPEQQPKIIYISQCFLGSVPPAFVPDLMQLLCNDPAIRTYIHSALRLTETDQSYWSRPWIWGRTGHIMIHSTILYCSRKIRNKLFLWMVFPGEGKLCKQKRPLMLSLLSQECYISSNYTESCGKVVKSLASLGKSWVQILLLVNRSKS